MSRNGYNPYGEDPTDDFDRWEDEQEEKPSRDYLRDMRRLEASEDSHEGRLD